MEIHPRVQSRLRELPDKPGCYLMRDRRGAIIYVGKAASLRKRVGSYFRNATLRRADPKLRGLVRSVADLEIIVTRTEAEAVLTEGQLIKDYRPRYNVDFKDDKRFLLLRVDLRQAFPRFELCRIRRDDGCGYHGPYASAPGARAALDFIEKRFGLRKCRSVIPTVKDHDHCINDVVRYCSAPCVGRIGREEYAGRVATACAFLRGEKPEYIAELRQKMEEAACALDFEKAAGLRDTYLRLRETVERAARVLGTPKMKRDAAGRGTAELAKVLGLAGPPRVIEAYDISNISGTLAVASMVCALDGMPHKNRYRRFRIKTVTGADDPAMMAEAVSRSVKNDERSTVGLPDLVLVDGGLGQLRAAENALAEAGMGHIPVAGLAKQQEELYHGNGREPIRLPADSPALLV
ncbi:MAG: GIY-YIG nuclease family protein, partial [bacterium]